jgi:hypothetical protein
MAARVGSARFHSPPRPLVVSVPPGLSEPEVRLRVDAAILVEEGIALGWVESDPVIRARLITNMRFARGEASPQPQNGDANREPNREPDADQDAALLAEAIALDMHHSDLIVRRRLISRAERLMWSDVRNERVSDDTLFEFMQAHASRFMAPPRFRYSEVFLSAQRHGDALDHAVATAQTRLREEAPAPEDAHALGDPLLFSPGTRWVGAEDLARRVGGELANELRDAPLEAWSGPYASSFGQHLVYVHERREGALPTLDEARLQVLGAYREDRRDAALERRLQVLRDAYNVTVRVEPSAP